MHVFEQAFRDELEKIGRTYVTKHPKHGRVFYATSPKDAPPRKAAAPPKVDPKHSKERIFSGVKVREVPIKGIRAGKTATASASFFDELKKIGGVAEIGAWAKRLGSKAKRVVLRKPAGSSRVVAGPKPSAPKPQPKFERVDMSKGRPRKVMSPSERVTFGLSKTQRLPVIPKGHTVELKPGKKLSKVDTAALTSEEGLEFKRSVLKESGVMNEAMLAAFQDELEKIGKAQIIRTTKRPKMPSQEEKIQKFKGVGQAVHRSKKMLRRGAGMLPYMTMKQPSSAGGMAPFLQAGGTSPARVGKMQRAWMKGKKGAQG